MPRIVEVEDQSDLAEARGELIPEDTYWDVLIEDVKLTQAGQQAKTPGADQYRMKLRILDEGPAKNRTHFITVSFQYAARFTLIQLNKAIGLPVTARDEVTGKEGLYVGDEHEYQGQHVPGRFKVDPTADFPINVAFLEQGATPAGAIKAAAGGTTGPVKSSGRVPLNRGRGGAPKAPSLSSVPDGVSVEESVAHVKSTEPTDVG